MKRKIWLEDPPCNHWIGGSRDEVLKKIEKYYGDFDEDESELRELADEDVVTRWEIYESRIHYDDLPPGAFVGIEGDYLYVEDTARQWLEHLPEDVPDPWLLGEW